MEPHLLSKSTYVRGIKCHKSLFLNRYHRELRNEIKESTQAIFDRGTEVGKFGQGFISILSAARKRTKDTGGAYVFGYPVKDPERFGVPSFDKDGNVVKITEKPKNPASNYAITGLYLYDKTVFEKIKKLKLIEELNIQPKINDLFLTVVHQYPDFELTMHSFLCDLNSLYQVIYFK